MPHHTILPVKIPISIWKGYLRASPKGQTPLYFAAKNGQIACIECLNNLGANVKDDKMAMMVAVTEGQIESIKCLKWLGADINDPESSTGMRPIHFAVAAGQIKSMECLRVLGATLDARDRKGRTALDLAIPYGQTEAAEWLRRNGG